MYARTEFLDALLRAEPDLFNGLRTMSFDEWIERWPFLATPGLEWLVEATRRSEAKIRAAILSAPTIGGRVSCHDIPPPALEWQPAYGLSRKEYHAQALKALSTYEDLVQRWASEHGVDRAYTREREAPAGAEGWDILVRRLVKGESFEKIAVERCEDRLTASAISKRTHKLAQQLGISLPRNRN